MKKQQVFLVTGVLFLLAIINIDSELTAGNLVSEKKILNVVVSSGKITEVAKGKDSQAVAGGISISGNKITADTTRKDNGIEKLERRDLSPYHVVDIRNFPGKILLQVGGKHSATVTADASVIPTISTIVNNGVLQVKLTENISTRMPLTLELNAERLSFFRISGVADATLKNLNENKFRLQINGSGSVEASGFVDELNGVMIGSGKMRLSNLAADRCVMTVNGSGKVEVHAINMLDGKIIGSGEIRYYGAPRNVSRKIRGSGRIEAVVD
ncbi:hypothetical protein KKHLCK_11415 [Candidatus Electrothrix laxa]